MSVPIAMTTLKIPDLWVPAASSPGARPTQEPQKGDFATHLKNALGQVDDLPQHASQAIEQLIGEGNTGLHETLAVLDKADVSFRLMMQIRNKVLEAYQEIMRMQI